MKQLRRSLIERLHHGELIRSHPLADEAADDGAGHVAPANKGHVVCKRCHGVSLAGVFVESSIGELSLFVWTALR
jgi:hypothetical protein